MELSIKQMKDNEANEISKWVYEKPYSIYSMEENESCLNELLNGYYFSAADKDANILGYYCFGESAQVPIGKQFGVYSDKNVVDMGLGLKPDLCGQALGIDFINEGVEFCRDEFSGTSLRLTVAAFNERAIKVYERVGFEKVNSFERVSENGKIEFWVMILK